MALGLRPHLRCRSRGAAELQRPSRSGTGPSHPHSAEDLRYQVLFLRQMALPKAVLQLIVFQLRLLQRSAWEGVRQ